MKRAAGEGSKSDGFAAVAVDVADVGVRAAAVAVAVASGTAGTVAAAAAVGAEVAGWVWNGSRGL